MGEAQKSPTRELIYDEWTRCHVNDLFCAQNAATRIESNRYALTVESKTIEAVVLSTSPTSKCARAMDGEKSVTQTCQIEMHK